MSGHTYTPKRSHSPPRLYHMHMKREDFTIDGIPEGYIVYDVDLTPSGQPVAGVKSAHAARGASGVTETKRRRPAGLRRQLSYRCGYAGSAAFAVSAIFANAGASRTARSASTLRSTSTCASFSPFISLE